MTNIHSSYKKDVIFSSKDVQQNSTLISHP